MGRFSRYIASTRVEGISKSSLERLVYEQAGSNLKFLKSSAYKIFRGDKRFTGAYGFINTDKGEPRVSANTFNYMTLLMDNLPSWKGWPKRSKSIVCSTYSWNALNYGKIYTIIPFDDAEIGICSDDDVWNSFDNLGIPVNDFNWFIHHLMMHGIKDAYEIKTLNDLKKAINEAIENFNNDELLVSAFTESDDYIRSHHEPLLKGLMKNDPMTFLNQLLDPNKNGFKRGIKNIKKDKEVWIQGKALLIQGEDGLNEIKDIFE